MCRFLLVFACLLFNYAQTPISVNVNKAKRDKTNKQNVSQMNCCILGSH